MTFALKAAVNSADVQPTRMSLLAASIPASVICADFLKCVISHSLLIIRSSLNSGEESTRLRLGITLSNQVLPV